MAGKLYGVGVGPGDPMLMTLKAVKTIESCGAYAVPSEKRESSAAYKIASAVVDLSGKKCIEIEMPMTKDKQKLAKAHEKGAGQLKAALDSGMDVAMLTLGDPTIYATYIYLHRKIEALGYETEIISGVPSFCAAAADLKIPLTEKGQELHVIPASYDAASALELEGTKIFMKAGSKMRRLKEMLGEKEKAQGMEVYMAQNCGMEGEKLYYGAADMDEDAGYYSIVICKDRA